VICYRENGQLANVTMDSMVHFSMVYNVHPSLDHPTDTKQRHVSFHLKCRSFNQTFTNTSQLTMVSNQSLFSDVPTIPLVIGCLVLFGVYLLKKIMIDSELHFQYSDQIALVFLYQIYLALLFVSFTMVLVLMVSYFYLSTISGVGSWDTSYYHLYMIYSSMALMVLSILLNMISQQNESATDQPISNNIYDQVLVKKTGTMRGDPFFGMAYPILQILLHTAILYRRKLGLNFPALINTLLAFSFFMLVLKLRACARRQRMVNRQRQMDCFPKLGDDSSLHMEEGEELIHDSFSNSNEHATYMPSETWKSHDNMQNNILYSDRASTGSSLSLKRAVLKKSPEFESQKKKQKFQKELDEGWEEFMSRMSS
jgi:hypothetical protein